MNFDTNPGNWSGFIWYVGLILLFCSYFLALEAILLSLTRRTATRGQLRKRLVPQNRPGKHLEALVNIRQRRSLSPDGDYTMPLIWLNRLVVQSGVMWGAIGFPAVFIGLSAILIAVVFILGGGFVPAVATGLLGGAGIPLLLLVYLRNRRRRKLETQLPESIDILVRGLKAGHPVSSAIRLVARELSDPIGTEFSIMGDELTYGLDLETAMNNMGSRVGQEDLALVVIAVGIQARSGGNLAEILSSISKVVRERLKLRMKVKAFSAEGRLSALVLSILPIGLFGLLWIITPNFYGEIWHVLLVKPILIASAIWLLIGDLVMYRMVKFEI